MVAEEKSVLHSQDEDTPTPSPTSPRFRDSLNWQAEQFVAECPFAAEQHEGKQLASISLRLPPKHIFSMIFRDENFLSKLYINRKFSDIVYTPWQQDPYSGEEIRKITYTATLPSTALGPSVSYITEVQILSNINKEDDLYVATTKVTNAGIPYANNFEVNIHYCIVKEKSSAPQVPQSKFSYYALVSFKKNTFFFIKNLIEKSTIEGLQALCNELVSELKLEADRLYGVDSGQTSPPMVEAAPEGETLQRRRKIKKRLAPVPVKSVFKQTSFWFLTLVFLFLLFMNAYLLKRMLHLEKVAQNFISPQHELEEPLTAEILRESLRTLKHREDFLYRTFDRWKDKLDSAVNALDEAEVAIVEIITSLPRYEDEWHKMQELTSCSELTARDKDHEGKVNFVSSDDMKE